MTIYELFQQYADVSAEFPEDVVCRTTSREAVEFWVTHFEDASYNEAEINEAPALLQLRSRHKGVKKDLAELQRLMAKGKQ